MSEEPTPLRLKPRVRPPEGGNAAPPAPPPATPPPAIPAPTAEADPTSKLRLKPKLAADSAVIPSPITAAPDASAAPPAEARVRLKPRLAVEAAATPAAAAPTPVIAPPPVETPAAPPPDAPAPKPAAVEPAVPPAVAAPPPAVGGPPKFSLKHKPAVPAPPAARPAVPAPPPPAAPVPVPAPAAGPGPGEPPSAETAKPASPPPFPVVAPAPAGGKSPAGIHIRAPKDTLEAELQPAAPPPPPKKKKSKVVLWFGLAALVVVGVGGFFAYQSFTAPPAPAPKAAPAAKATGTTATEKLAATTAGSENVVDKAQNVLAERRKADQAKLDALVNGQDAGERRVIDTPPPSDLTAKAPPPKAPPAPQPSGATNLAPGVSATTSDVQAAADSSPGFRSFVANAVVKGVVAPKAFINGRVVTVGQVIDIPLGITFERIDAEKRTLVFKDKTGAIVTKKY